MPQSACASAGSTGGTTTWGGGKSTDVSQTFSLAILISADLEIVLVSIRTFSIAQSKHRRQSDVQYSYMLCLSVPRAAQTISVAQTISIAQSISIAQTISI
jgi:hypothetical protein